MKPIRNLPIALVLALVTLTACNASINAPIRVGDGETRSGGLSTVNGGITVGSDATVGGSCKSVNGGIKIGERSRVGGIKAVNGPIRVGREVQVDGGVDSVNGPVSLDRGTRVAGGVETINGPIELTGAIVDLDLRTVNGSIGLHEQSVVKGDIVIEDKLGNSRRRHPLEIEITGGSVVEGDLIVEDQDLEVRVLLRDGGKVLGRVENAQIVE